MNMRPYGKLGYEVSALGMGCMRLPRVFDQDGNASVDLEKAFELLRYAANNGINYFDSALTYHSRNSEAVLGEALEGGLRKKVKIATKQMFRMMTSPAEMRKNLENTLGKLRTDYIDVYLVHNIQASFWPDIERSWVFEELEKVRGEGLIKAIGFSYHGGYDGFKAALDGYDWDMCQVQQNLLDTDQEVTSQAIEDAGNKGCALVIMEPLRGGGLVTPPKAVQDVYDEWPQKRSGAEWAFRHLLNYPQVSTILSGMTTLEQLKENIALFSQPDAVANCLSEQEKDILVRAKAAYDNISTIPCTACEYCLPCPHGVNIPGVFTRYNDGMRFDSFNQSQRSYWLLLKGNQASAAFCKECGACMSKCPQHINIIEQLKVAHEKLDGWAE